MAEQALLQIINFLLQGKYIIAHCADPEWKHLRKEKGFPQDLFMLNKGARVVGVEMDKYFVDVLRDEKDDKYNFVLPHEKSEFWNPNTTDMMYMAISCEATPKIEAIIVFRKGIREHLIAENISLIAVGHKEKRKREITYQTIMTRKEIEDSLYISLICGANSRYTRVSELLFFFACAIQTSFTHVTLWIIHSRKYYPLQPLIQLYTSRFGMIYPRTSPSPSHPFFLVMHPSGEPLRAPFIMFQKRERVVMYGLESLSKMTELQKRIFTEISADDDVDDKFDTEERMAKEQWKYGEERSESESESENDEEEEEEEVVDGGEDEDDEYKVDLDEAEIEEKRGRTRSTFSPSSVKQKTKTESPKQPSKPPNKNSPLTKKPTNKNNKINNKTNNKNNKTNNSTPPTSTRVTRSMARSTDGINAGDNLARSLSEIQLK